MKKQLQSMWFAGLFAICLSNWVGASMAYAARGVSPAELTYDLGASMGSYGGRTYSEVNLGLNWFLRDFLVWRNAVFARFPENEDTLTGLDTSMRFQAYGTSGDGTFGAGLFGGPGYRLSKTEYSALFVEAGAQLKIGGIHIGGGAKVFNYTNPGRDGNGASLPKNDTVYFLILSGGGAL